MIDSNDRARIDDHCHDVQLDPYYKSLPAKEELHSLLLDEELRDAVLLVFANKQDLDGMSVNEICNRLCLDSIKDRKWHIQGTCALSGAGLYEGLEWLKNALTKKK